mmetsp:Transcript_71598/g.221093  ORF Transcript_71598/g.221093 Transcript_71598/m.221093 type:complete len:332 (-) Transcript_71598:19-1014(-)
MLLLSLRRDEPVKQALVVPLHRLSTGIQPVVLHAQLLHLLLPLSYAPCQGRPLGPDVLQLMQLLPQAGANGLHTASAPAADVCSSKSVGVMPPAFAWMQLVELARMTVKDGAAAVPVEARGGGEPAPHAAAARAAHGLGVKVVVIRRAAPGHVVPVHRASLILAVVGVVVRVEAGRACSPRLDQRKSGALQMVGDLAKEAHPILRELPPQTHSRIVAIVVDPGTRREGKKLQHLGLLEPLALHGKLTRAVVGRHRRGKELEASFGPLVDVEGQSGAALGADVGASKQVVVSQCAWSETMNVSVPGCWVVCASRSRPEQQPHRRVGRHLGWP